MEQTGRKQKSGQREKPAGKKEAQETLRFTENPFGAGAPGGLIGPEDGLHFVHCLS
ncbi:MAG TPA: hypothetical protein VNQ90_21350 [Chthoniobacteraceae bacterium]|nr:hypothetical protein [Chthoniobacteraceae bacterium]